MINLVLEIGTANSKIGFTAQSMPRITTDSLLLEADPIKTQHQEESELFGTRQPKYFGNTIDLWRNDIAAHNIFDLKWQDQHNKLGLLGQTPIRDAYTRFMGELINEVRQGQQGECGLILVQSPAIKKYEINKIREMICEYLFDQLNLNQIYFVKSTVASCLAQGRASGVVVDSGQNFTSISRVHDGYNEHSTLFNFGGNMLSFDIQNYISKRGMGGSLTFNNRKGQHFQQLVRLRELKTIKERLSSPINSQIEEERCVQVQLPDKQKITIDKQQIEQPFIHHIQFKKISEFILPATYKGLPNAIADIIEESPHGLAPLLAKSIIYTGGNMCYNSLLYQCDARVKDICSRKELKSNMVVNDKKLLSSWIGGSLIGSLSSFTQYWVTQKEWKESGFAAVSKKCA